MTPTIRHWYIVVPATVLLWVLFKCCYPYADFFNDSYTYIQAAVDQAAISYRPIGYSLFLRLIHSMSSSDTLLVTIQFLLVQSASWLLFLTACRYYAPGRLVKALIAIFLLFNPLTYYICNFVSSDALFMSLSLFWLASLMQSMRRPTWRGIIIQWTLLLAIFFTRYAALFYPLVAAISYGWLPRGWRFRLIAMAGSVTIVTAAVVFTREMTIKDTGTLTFSAFSGWQMANNALHLYPWLPVDSAGLPPETATLGRYVDRYFSREGNALKKKPLGATTTYMWERSSPLHAYFDDYRRLRSSLRGGADTLQLSYFTAWNRVGPTFGHYGYFLMKRHPVAYSRYYLWPSAKTFFLSPLDVLARYLDGKQEIDPIARDWFGYHVSRPRVCSATLQGNICAPYPWLSLILTVAFAVTATTVLVRRELRNRFPTWCAGLRIAAIYLGVNLCFNVFASPSVYRYQALPLILMVIFTATGFAVLRPFFVSYHKQSNHG